MTLRFKTFILIRFGESILRLPCYRVFVGIRPEVGPRYWINKLSRLRVTLRPVWAISEAVTLAFEAGEYAISAS